MSRQHCLIGIDAGTSVVKAVAFDPAGRELITHELPLPLRQPHPLWAEQDMNELWRCVRTALGAVARRALRAGWSVGGVGVTSTGDGTFLINRQGRPVRRGMLWCDGRSGPMVEQLHASGVAAAAFPICGTSVFTGSQVAQIAWLRAHEPAALRSATTIFHAKDWLFYQLTGVISSDETDESLTLLRMSTRQYDPELFRLFGIEDLRDRYPAVVPCEKNVAELRPALARELGLPSGTPVGSGPMDVAACALGSGAIEAGQASTVLGTAGIHQLIMDQPLLEPHLVGMTLCHGVPGRWLRLMAAMTATPNLDWYLAQFAPELVRRHRGDKLYPELEKIIAGVPAGAEGVMFHPYLFPGGERGPFVRPSARASFTGLSLNHTRAHLLRAIYEGVALATLDCYRHMPAEPSSVRLSGGGARSDAWCQIVADCLGKPVSVPEGSQFGAKGAAINIGVATGFYRDARDAVKRTVQVSRSYRPRRARTQLYGALYEIYRETAGRQMDLWDRRAALFQRHGH